MSALARAEGHSATIGAGDLLSSLRPRFLLAHGETSAPAKALKIHSGDLTGGGEVPAKQQHGPPAHAGDTRHRH